MWNRIDFVFVLQCCADGHRTGSFACTYLIKTTVGAVAKDEILAVVGNINEGRLKLYERVYTFPQSGNVCAL